MQYTRYVFRELLKFIEANDIEVVSGQPDNIPDLLATSGRPRHTAVMCRSWRSARADARGRVTASG